MKDLKKFSQIHKFVKHLNYKNNTFYNKKIRENILLILFIIVSIFFLIVYLNISAEYEKPELDNSDAFGYLNEGIHLRDVSYDFREIINRNRTPGLPLIISFLAQNKGPLIQNSEEYIELFKETQLAIILFVFLISFISFLKIKNKFRSNILIIFFFIYFYSVPITAQMGWVYVEPIFMSLYLLFIITAIDVMKSNVRKDHIILGLVGGFLFLAKYTGFLIFIFTIFSLLIYKIFFLKNNDFVQILINLFLSFVTFVTVGLPYIIANISDGINPFYSVNAKIMWYSSATEAEAYWAKYGGNFGFKDIPENLYPSLTYFLNNNGGYDGLIDRIMRGIYHLKDDFSDVGKLAGETLMYSFFLLGLIIFISIIVSVSVTHTSLWNNFKKHLFEIFFLVSLTSVLLFGFLLYHHISNGNRIYLFITIPIIYYLFYLVDYFLTYTNFEGKKKIVFNSFLISCFVYFNLIIYDVFWFLLHPLGFIKGLFT